MKSPVVRQSGTARRVDHVRRVKEFAVARFSLPVRPVGHLPLSHRLVWGGLVLCLALLTSGIVVRAENRNSKDKAAAEGFPKLTKKHGPWMIMVASFRNVPKDRRSKGLSAEEAADALITELRAKGIPAYVYSQDAVLEHVTTVDRTGRDDSRVFAAQRDMVCVLAGNYPNVEDEVAQKTLKWVKRFQPKFIAEGKSGAVYRQDSKAGPFGGAFMTINPLLDPTEVAKREPDPVLVRLNNDINFALVDCKRKYTVKVATFTGKSGLPIADNQVKEAAANFDRLLKRQDGFNLNRAGEDANQMVRVLRAPHQLDRTPVNQVLPADEAYVYHDRYQSIVTVGSFDSLDDDRIPQIIERFRAKQINGPTGEQLTAGESISIGPEQNRMTLCFDPIPLVIEVPHLR